VLEDGTDVKLLAIGEGYDVAVTESDQIWVRGKSKFRRGRSEGQSRSPTSIWPSLQTTLASWDLHPISPRSRRSNHIRSSQAITGSSRCSAVDGPPLSRAKIYDVLQVSFHIGSSSSIQS
jgi:hypothetical protein